MMDLLDLVVVIFFYIVPLCVSAVVVPRQLEKLSSNSYSLAKIIVIGLLATIIPTFLLYFGNYLFPLFSGFIYIAFLLSPFAVVVGVILRLFVIRLRLKPEEIIIDLGRIQNKLYALFGFGFVVFYIFIFAFQAFFLTVSDDRFRNIFMALMVLNTIGPSLVAIIYFSMSFSKVYVTRYGFSRFRLESLNWEDIKAYQWRGADDEKIELMLKARREIFLNIPLEHQARLDDILKVEVGLELPNRNYFRIPIPAKEQL